MQKRCDPNRFVASLAGRVDQESQAKGEGPVSYTHLLTVSSSFAVYRRWKSTKWRFCW